MTYMYIGASVQQSEKLAIQMELPPFIGARSGLLICFARWLVAVA
jgi:hypothetical protein